MSESKKKKRSTKVVTKIEIWTEVNIKERRIPTKINTNNKLKVISNTLTRFTKIGIWKINSRIKKKKKSWNKMINKLVKNKAIINTRWGTGERTFLWYAFEFNSSDTTTLDKRSEINKIIVTTTAGANSWIFSNFS